MRSGTMALNMRMEQRGNEETHVNSKFSESKAEYKNVYTYCMLLFCL